MITDDQMIDELPDENKYENPYKEFRPYNEDDEKYFAGRDEEKKKLLRLVKNNFLTVVYGKSGIGKTSLLKAGLFPKLRREKFLPLPIRVNYREAELIEQARRLISDELKNNNIIPRDEKDKSGGFRQDETLWGYFRRVTHFHRKNKIEEQIIPVILLDQFEEFFTIGKNHSERDPWINQLFYLVEDEIPESLRQQILDDEDEFPYLEKSLDLRIIISLREDYLPHLAGLTPRIPSIDRSQFRVIHFDRIQATKVINLGFKDEESVDKILKGINQTAESNQFEVDPISISLICYQLFKKLEIKAITKKTQKELLRDFYDSILADYSPNVESLIEEKLLTDEGERTLCAINQVPALVGPINKLIDRGLFRRVHHGEREYVELSHDVLISTVKEKRDEKLSKIRSEKMSTAMEYMPTGFFHIKNGIIIYCNKYFARLMGYGSERNVIGSNANKLFIRHGAFEKFINDLRDADSRREPLQNYEVLSKKHNSNQTITISIDFQIVRDEKGNEIGSEGTIRDISEMVELKETVKKISSDMNSLMHTFLHPVVKFSGNAELQYRVAKALHQTIQPGIASTSKEQKDKLELGDLLLDRLKKIIVVVPDSDEPLPSSQFAIKSTSKKPIEKISFKVFKKRLRRISYILEYSLEAFKSHILINDAIRDTALRLLEEFNRYDFSGNDLLRLIISSEFFKFLQNILFKYLINGARQMVDETVIMKQKVEALRSYIGLKRKKKLSFVQHDLSSLLKKNLKFFTPIFSEKEIKIDYKESGNLTAMISPHDIDRTIHNLLANALKYSYSQNGRFVKLRAKELEHINQVEISIENIGLPIKKEEIDSGRIWQFGYRGELAFASDRDGMGVGLADSKDTIAAHDGEIKITSRPAKPGNDPFPPKYKVPYLTQITIRIPKSRKKKVEE